MTLKTVLEQLNIPAQCQKYRVPLKQCPQFLFVVMGILIILFSIFAYTTGTRFIYVAEPELTSLIEYCQGLLQFMPQVSVGDLRIARLLELCKALPPELGARYTIDPRMVAFGVLLFAAALFAVGYAIVQGFEKVAEASRIKSEFISIVSHQLRTPITNLHWTVDMLLSGRVDTIQMSEKQKEYFQILNQNITRMNDLVQDLLMVSRLEQEGLPKRLQEISVSDFVKDLMIKLDPMAKLAEVQLKFLAEPQLPKILVDPSHFRIILENIIGNAIRYNKKGGIVDIKAARKDRNIVLTVRDEGIGIPKEDQKYVFQKFFRAENARNCQPHGTGLGLYIAKMILETFGGKIGFESQQNKGSTFWFTIPIK